MSGYVPKLVQLPGTKLSPEVVLHRSLNKLDHIDHVLVIIGWKDGSVDCDWSQMTISQLCFADVSLTMQIQELLRGNRPECLAPKEPA